MHLIPFILSEFFMNKDYGFGYRSNIFFFGYLRMHEIINDNDLYKEIKQKFDFSIKTFREQYSFNPFVYSHLQKTNILEWIFSIKNSPNKKHKVIRFLGFRISIKKRRTANAVLLQNIMAMLFFGEMFFVS